MTLSWRSLYAFPVFIFLLVFIFVVALLAPRIFYTIDSGQAGVLYRFFWGTETQEVYDEGLEILCPWNKLYIYDIREQELTERVNVLSYNGLSMGVVFSFRYRPDFETLPLLHQNIGPDYVEKVVKPVLIAAVREVIGNYRPEELYTTHSATIQEEIRRLSERDISQQHIRFSQILVKDIDLPATIEEAIEDKLALQQVAEGYDFRLVSEERERLRKKIEAEGIRTYNEIVSEGLNDKLFKYLNIAAVQALSTSDNSKVVVLGGPASDGVMFPIQIDGATRGAAPAKGAGEGDPTDKWTSASEVEQGATTADPAASPPEVPISQGGGAALEVAKKVKQAQAPRGAESPPAGGAAARAEGAGKKKKPTSKSVGGGAR